MLAPTTTTKEDELIADRASQSVRSREADFQRAQAHSSKVRMLKWSLPTLGLALALAFGGYTFLSRVPQLTYDIASVAYADGKLVMANPKVNGVTAENRPYSMTAARAVQDIANDVQVSDQLIWKLIRQGRFPARIIRLGIRSSRRSWTAARHSCSSNRASLSWNMGCDSDLNYQIPSRHLCQGDA